LDNLRALEPADFDPAAKHCVLLIKASLGLLGGESGVLPAMRGNVVNVNFPYLGTSPLQGFYLTHMSSSCAMPTFAEVTEEQKQAALQRAGVGVAPGRTVVMNSKTVFQKCAQHAIIVPSTA
jgi:hypothetical protein